MKVLKIFYTVMQSNIFPLGFIVLLTGFLWIANTEYPVLTPPDGSLSQAQLHERIMAR